MMQFTSVLDGMDWRIGGHGGGCQDVGESAVE